MPVDLLAQLFAELVIGAGTAIATGKANQWIRDNKLNEFFQALNDNERRAMLEVVSAAALHDGKLTDSEKAMLTQLTEKSDAQLVDAALDAVRAALPFANAAAEQAFLSQRSKAFSTAEQRESVFATATFLLLSTSTPESEASVQNYATAFGVTPEAVENARMKWNMQYMVLTT